MEMIVNSIPTTSATNVIASRRSPTQDQLTMQSVALSASEQAALLDEIFETEARILDTVERELLPVDLFDNAIDRAVARISQQSPVFRGIGALIVEPPRTGGTRIG